MRLGQALVGAARGVKTRREAILRKDAIQALARLAGGDGQQVAGGIEFRQQIGSAGKERNVVLACQIVLATEGRPSGLPPT